MCWGAVIASAALSGLGGALKNASATRQAAAQANARNQVLQSTLDKNRPIAADSRAQFSTRMDDLTPTAMAADQQSAQANRQAVMDTAVAAPTGGNAPVASSAPDIVKSAVADRMLSAFNDAKTQATSLGKVGSYGDYWYNQGVKNGDLGRGLGVNANFAGGNLALLPAEQDLAEYQATKPPSPIGGILMGLGNAVGSAAGSGFFNRGG